MKILEKLLGGLKAVCNEFTDQRKSENVTYSMADIGISAFSLFFMQSESFLSHQRGLQEGHGSSNCQTLFGMEKIPTDNHIRSMLDEVNPNELQPCFDDMLKTFETHGGLESFQQLGNRTLIALDGTEYFCSQKLGCPSCQTRKRKNGKIEKYHTMLAASIVAPGHNMAVPLMPEFITPQDGDKKQDCERKAVKRWLTAHRNRFATLNPIYLGDDLFSCQPIAEAVLQNKADFLFVCKQKSHKTLYDFIKGGTLDELSVTITHPGRKKLNYRYRWVEGVPIRDGKDALDVNWIAVTVTNAKGKETYNGAFVTSLTVSKDNVADLVAMARARWKIENESFNVLKNNGYHLEHNFGHGKKNLAMVFATMNLLAFAFHTVCDCLEDFWKNARKLKHSRNRLFEHIRTLTVYLVFPSWKSLMNTLIDSKPPPELLTQ